MFDPLALFPPAPIMAALTTALLGTFGYTRPRRIAAGIAIAALSCYLAELPLPF